MRIDIGQFLAKRAWLDGGKPALVADGYRLTFAALEAKARRAAHLLRAYGIGRGDRIAVLLPNGIEYVALYYGAAKLGAILCGINWRLAGPEIAYILANSEPKLFVYHMNFHAAVAGIGDRLPKLAVGIDLDDDLCFHKRFEAQPASDPGGAAEADDPLVLVYTSGTTGRPKGAVLTHRQMFWASVTLAASHDYSRGDVNLVPTPLFHVGGLSFATLFVHMGATLALPPAGRTDLLLKWIEWERANHFFAVPTMLRAMLDHPGFAAADLSSLRWILCGGAPVPRELIDAFGKRGIPVQQTYGSTETAGPATMVDTAHAREKAGSAGLPYFHTDLRIVDAGGAEVPPETVGEIQVRAPHLFQGYWRNPEATAAAFAGDWLRTGDLGRRDAEGYLTIVDRAKDVVISGGENIYPAEVEAVLREHPNVAEVAVIGLPDRDWGEVPCAVVVPRDGAAPTLEALAEFCAGRIARFKRPRRLVLRTQALPRNASGKVLKPALRAELGGEK